MAPRQEHHARCRRAQGSRKGGWKQTEIPTGSKVIRISSGDFLTLLILPLCGHQRWGHHQRPCCLDEGHQRQNFHHVNVGHSHAIRVMRKTKPLVVWSSRYSIALRKERSICISKEAELLEVTECHSHFSNFLVCCILGSLLEALSWWLHKHLKKRSWGKYKWVSPRL